MGHLKVCQTKDSVKNGNMLVFITILFFFLLG